MGFISEKDMVMPFIYVDICICVYIYVPVDRDRCFYTYTGVFYTRRNFSLVF